MIASAIDSACANLQRNMSVITGFNNYSCNKHLKIMSHLIQRLVYIWIIATILLVLNDAKSRQSRRYISNTLFRMAICRFYYQQLSIQLNICSQWNSTINDFQLIRGKHFE